jgi:hypothetical protein
MYNNMKPPCFSLKIRLFFRFFSDPVSDPDPITFISVSDRIRIRQKVSDTSGSATLMLMEGSRSIQIITDPDSGGPNTYESYESGSDTPFTSAKHILIFAPTTFLYVLILSETVKKTRELLLECS